MKDKPAWLFEFKSDVYSQTGEDGIIEKILEILPEKDKWCVEFGAWDGIYLSNVRNLIEKEGYSAIFIEGSGEKYGELRRNYSNYKNITCINSFVGFSGKDNLDEILKRTLIPEKFDLLSVDIDGNDYHVWKAISKYVPKVVVIEFNPTIPTEISFIQKADPLVNQGASLLALVELGKEKGYELVSVLPFNAFFVRSEYFPLFQIRDNSPASLRQSLSDITYIFSGYDGNIFLYGSKKLPWHGIDIDQSKIQQLPRLFRKFPCNYTIPERFLWLVYSVFRRFRRDPRDTTRRVIAHIKALLN